MSIKSKIMNVITTHLKLVTLGIGLAITFVGGTVIGMISSNMVSAAGLEPCVNHIHPVVCRIF